MRAQERTSSFEDTCRTIQDVMIYVYIYINKHDSHICSFETCSLGPRGLVAFSSVETREHKKTRRTPPKTRNPKWLLCRQLIFAYDDAGEGLTCGSE